MTHRGIEGAPGSGGRAAREVLERLRTDEAAEAGWLDRLMRRLSTEPSVRWDSVSKPAEDQVAVVALLEQALSDPATASWGDLAREQLLSSLEDLRSDDARWMDAARGAQRLMCWAGPYASRFTCGMM